MIKILSISSAMPFDGVPHAGGKTYNTYIKKLAKEKNFDISVLAFSKKKDLFKNDLKKYQIHDLTIISSGPFFINLFHIIFDFVGKFENYGKLYSGYKKHMVMRKLRLLEKKKQLPDIIELEWTDMVLLAKDIKQRYPNIKLIASEHDVTFLGAYRRYQTANVPEKKHMKRKFELIKKMELEALQHCDIVMPHNYKDRNLLINNGISDNKIFTIVPYYHDMSFIQRKNVNRDILFWGAMGRDENAEACRWFIKNVMPLLENLNIRFIIAGNNPPTDLLEKASDKIIVTGYIEDETSLFENSLCFVCPLINGAGIKVKILEAMSSGIPVLTNDVGIEGIPGEDGVSYYKCITPEQYLYIIEKLLNDEKKGILIGQNAKKLIEKNFNLESSIKNYINMLKHA